VRLQNQLLFLRHRGEVAVQAVDHHHARRSIFDVATDRPGEFARRNLGRINLSDRQGAAVDMFLQVETHRLGAHQQGSDALVELKQDRAFAALAGRTEVLQR